MFSDFTFTSGWSALLTAVVAVLGPLAGVVVTQMSGRKSERERAAVAAAERADDRAHERERWEAQTRAERRASLHADRRARYVAFRHKFVEYQRAEAELNEGFGEFQRRAGAPEAPGNEFAREQFIPAVQRWGKAKEELEATLIDIEAVASLEVYNAAAALRESAAAGGPLQLAQIVVGPHNEDLAATMRQQLAEAEHTISAAEERLRAAIRAELELDQ